MADNRKDFRPRRLAFGGRIFPRACGLAAALAICAVVGAASAEDAGLKNGAASLSAGKYDVAVRQLSATINSDTATPGDAAKALYLRGLAYRKMGESARAIADLGAAIWLGLPESDKIKAQVNRGLAYKSAGLSREGEVELAAARKAGGNSTVDTIIAEGGGEGAAAIAAFSTEVRPNSGGESVAARNETAAPPTRTADASPTAWSTSVSDDQQPSSSSSGNQLTRWFGSVTAPSDSDAAPAPAAAPVPAPAPQAAATPPPKPAAPPPPSAAAASSSWSTTTESQQASANTAGGDSGSRWSRLFNRSAEAEAPAQPAPAVSGGGFPLQLATSRSEAEAKALWKQVAQSVAGAQPQIEKVEIGNFGTFWSLRIGPFTDKAESLKVCNALKRSGIDCSPVTP